MDEIAYCGECKWFYEQTVCEGGDLCNNKTNLVIRDTWYKREYDQRVSPKEKNSDNNCKEYEPRPDRTYKP